MQIKRWGALLAVFFCAIALDPALAQPFGLHGDVTGGFAGYILVKQAEFYRMLSGTLRAA